MKQFRPVIIGALVLMSTLSFSNKMTVFGVFKGQNLIIQNSYYAAGSMHCITGIYINQKKIKVDVNVSAVSVPLKSLHLDEGTKLQIDIYYHRECGKPKILNLQAIEKDGRFHITSVKLNQNKISWLAQGEQPGGSYFIEHMQNGEWARVAHIQEQGNVSEDYYTHPVEFFSGNNEFRIAYLEADSTVIYSEVASIMSHVSPVHYTPVHDVEKTITFSRASKFVITDLKHKVLIKGEGKVVDCSSLTPKEYYTVMFDNQIHHFRKGKIKKEKKKKEKN